MKRTTLLLAAALAVLPACSEDQNDNGLRFTLTIINNTASPYDVFMNTNQDALGFRAFGSIAASSTTPLSGLVPSAIYTFRLSPVGQGAGAFVYERQVASGGANVTWAVP